MHENRLFDPRSNTFMQSSLKILKSIMKKKSFTHQNVLTRKFAGYAELLKYKWHILLLLLVVAVSCKKINEEPGLTGVCPIVISTSPGDTATNVSINRTVNATFNETMNAATINAVSFTLVKGTTPVAGVVSTTGAVATFTPTTNLTPNSLYKATIKAGVRDPQGNAMINDYTWSFTTGAGPDIIAPRVISTDPANAATAVAFNKKISATFSEVMDSLSTTTSFLINNTTLGGTPITGTVTYSGTTAVFTPSILLSPNTTYAATITTGAKDLAGNTLVSNYVWNFTTSASIIPPVVTSTDPVNNAFAVPLNKIITATFSQVMDPATITALTFKLNNGAIPVVGTVTYSGNTATFTPTPALVANVIYTATITTGAKNMGGTPLANNYVWSFSTSATPPPPSILGTAAYFGAFGGNAGITNQGLFTAINNGGIGTTAASTLVTGFHDGMTGDVYTETPLNVGYVMGRIYTAPPAPGTATSFAIASQGLVDANAAYLSISPAAMPGGIDPGAGELGGLTLAPGVYKSASGTFKITNGNLTLDAQGDPNATWVFQTAAGLTVGVAGPTGAKSVIMINGALPKNVYWYVGSAATINAAGGGVMVGNIIASAGVTFSTAGNVTLTVLNGRAISLVASVTLVNTVINVPN